MPNSNMGDNPSLAVVIVGEINGVQQIETFWHTAGHIQFCILEPSVHLGSLLIGY